MKTYQVLDFITREAVYTGKHRTPQAAVLKHYLGRASAQGWKVEIAEGNVARVYRWVNGCYDKQYSYVVREA